MSRVDSSRWQQEKAGTQLVFLTPSCGSNKDLLNHLVPGPVSRYSSPDVGHRALAQSKYAQVDCKSVTLFTPGSSTL